MEVVKRNRRSPWKWALLMIVFLGIAIAAAFFATDRSITPDYVSTKLRRGMSMQEVHSSLPRSTPIKQYSGDWPFWVLNGDASALNFFAPPEITLRFDNDGVLRQAYYSVGIDERMHPISLSE